MKAKEEAESWHRSFRTCKEAAGEQQAEWLLVGAEPGFGFGTEARAGSAREWQSELDEDVHCCKDREEGGVWAARGPSGIGERGPFAPRG